MRAHLIGMGQTHFYRLSDHDCKKIRNLHMLPGFDNASDFNYMVEPGEILPIIITEIKVDKHNTLLTISGQVILNTRGWPFWVTDIPLGMLEELTPPERIPLIHQARLESGVWYRHYPSYLVWDVVNPPE